MSTSTKKKWILYGATGVVGLSLLAGGAVAAANAMDFRTQTGQVESGGTLTGLDSAVSNADATKVTANTTASTPSAVSAATAVSAVSVQSAASKASAVSAASPASKASPPSAVSAPSPVSVNSPASAASAASADSL